jgi:hypothetical protein
MTEPEALDLLVRFSQHLKLTEDEKAAAKEIVKMLGYLPLAIDQTAWFISEISHGFRKHLVHFNKFKSSVIKRMPDGNIWNYRRDDKSENWFTTYEHSLASLEGEKRRALTSFLTVSAFFADAAIHEDFFRRYCEAKPAPDENGVPSWLSLFSASDSWEVAYREQVRELSNRSLVQFQRDEQWASDGFHYSLHPVIREWLLVRTDPGLGGSSTHKEDDHASIAVAILAAFVRATDINSMPLQTRIDVLAHINKFIADQAECLYAGAPNAAGISTPAQSFAIFCWEFSRMKTSKRLLEKVLTSRTAAGIPESDAENVEILIELGLTSAANAEHAIAEGYFRKALEHGKKLEKPRRCQVLVGLVNAMGTQGHFRSARDLAKKAMQLATTFDEQGSTRVAIEATLAMANVEGSYLNVGQAKRLHDEAFERAKRNWGENDNLTLEAELSTANVPEYEGRPDDAKSIVKRVQKRIEEQNGLNHRLALNTRLRPGLIYGRYQSHAKARKCFELAKSRALVLLGDSPGDVDINNPIGHTYAGERNLGGAQDIFDKAATKSRGRDGYEVVFLHVSIALLLLHVRRFQFLQGIPHIANFVRYFPFVPFFKAHKVLLLLAIGACLLVLDSSLRGSILTTVCIFLGLVAVGFIL